MDLSLILTALKELREWFGDWFAMKKARNEREKHAVQVLLGTITKTQQYLGDLDAGNTVDRTRETELAVAWTDAAMAFHGINEEVAPLLQLKSEAWARPEAWSDRELREAGITIEAISEMARQFLAGKAPGHTE
jgi:hypothetical protein